MSLTIKATAEHFEGWTWDDFEPGDTLEKFLMRNGALVVNEILDALPEEAGVMLFHRGYDLNLIFSLAVSGGSLDEPQRWIPLRDILNSYVERMEEKMFDVSPGLISTTSALLREFADRIEKCETTCDDDD